MNKDIENEISTIIDNSLKNKSFESLALKLAEAVKNIEEASKLFKNANMNYQKDKLNHILAVIEQSIINNNSIKTIKANSETIDVDVDFNEDMSLLFSDDLNDADLGDINLTDDDLKQLEVDLSSETFEDEK